MTIHKLTGVDGYFADRSTRYLLTALFGEQEAGDWRDEALCAQIDPDAFFPEKGGSVREAKRVCSDCPVRAECLEAALANDERYGVWGGLSERERRPLRRIDVDDVELPAEGEKCCRSCLTIRALNAFSRHSSRRDGRRDDCKRCDVKARRNRRSQSGERHSVAA